MRLLVVSCFRVHLYKNMYQRNLQQCLINTHFWIISGCQAEKSKWPSSPRCSGVEQGSLGKARGGRSRGATPFPLWVRTQLPGSPRSQAPGEERWLLVSGLLGCDIGESLSPLPAGLGWGSNIEMTRQNLDSGLVVSDSFLALSYDKVLRADLVQALSELWNRPFLQEALVCFSEKWYFPIIMWVLETNMALGWSLFPCLLVDRARNMFPSLPPSLPSLPPLPSPPSFLPSFLPSIHWSIYLFFLSIYPSTHLAYLYLPITSVQSFISI